ncbi:MAG: hypothetical protein V8S26_11115 [Lachnospiraceae bacterium]
MKKITKLVAFGLAATMTAGLTGCGIESRAATPSSIADTAKASQADEAASASTAAQTESSESYPQRHRPMTPQQSTKSVLLSII